MLVVTGLPLSSGPRTRSPWAVRTTKDSTNQSCTAGRKATNTIGVVTGQGDVWSFDKPTASPLHPTTKPVQRAIENSSSVREIVLDLFLGSGTNLIACERSSRICYGMELEPNYVDVAVMRWEAFTGEKATKETQ